MFGKMMNRFYYGKSGKGDYTKDDLPETRWQLFWEMLRVRFSALLRLNLMYMIAWIPAMLVIGRAVTLLYSGLVNISEMTLQVEAGEIAAEMLAQANATYAEAIKAIVMQTLLLLVPCIAITGPVTAGVAFVTRNWARDEHAFIWSDFIDAAKTNWKQALLTSTITGFVPLLIYVCFNFYGDMASSNAIFAIPQMLTTMLGLVWLCSLMYIYPQMVTYDLNYRSTLRNSLIMTIGRLPITVGIKLLSLVPLIICAAVCLFTPYAQYALLVYLAYYILLGYALSRFVQASCANAAFDRYLNVKIEGAEVGRGLYNEEDDEEEAASSEENPSADL